MVKSEFKIRVGFVSSVAALTLLLSCSGGAGGFEAAGKKDTKKPADDEKKTDEPAEVAGAFLSCVTGIEDDIVKPGQVGVGCGVYSKDKTKLVTSTLIFKGQILDANKSPMVVASRNGTAADAYHYIASVSTETVASGYAAMRVEKMGSNQSKDFEPVLLNRAQSFAACSPNCPPAETTIVGAGSWALYGLVTEGNSSGVATQIDAALTFVTGTTSAAVASSFKSKFTSTATALNKFVDKGSELKSRGTPDWVGLKKSCSIIPDVPYRDFGKVAVYSVRLLNDVELGKYRHLVVAVDKGDKSFDELKNMTSPSTHPVCAAAIAEKPAIAPTGATGAPAAMVAPF